MSIIGEPISGEVATQIYIRQNLHGKQTRTNTDINLLSNTNAWLKLASSVRVISQTDAEISASTAENKIESIPTYNPTTRKYEEEESNISTGEQRLRDIGLTNTSEFTGNQLAKKAVLFNTLSELSPKGNTYINRSGVSTTQNLWDSNSSYGLGSTDFGIVPSPGLISAKIDCKNRGSIREATIELKAYNKFQFELIELLYLRLGYSMLLEWGWDKYLDKDAEIKSMGNTLIEDLWFQDLCDYSYRKVIDDIATYRRKIYDNNYDGFLGKVVNFDWSFQPDGTYDITLKLITIGDVIESLKVNLPNNLITEKQLNVALGKGGTRSEDLLKSKSPIITNAGSSTLSLNLFKDITEDKVDWSKDQGEYTSLFKNLIDGDNYNPITGWDSKNSKAMKYPPTGTDSNKYTYFLTFGALLTKLNRLCVPSINNSKILQFDLSGDNICSAFPNQISFNPKICLIKPQFSTDISLTAAKWLTGVKDNWNTFAKLKPFFISETKKGKTILYGDIRNIYLNYDFITNTLQENTNKDGEISIYKFLEDICNNINSSLGGLNKLEPILEDDSKVKIIDQNPIPGIENSTTFSSRFGETVPFEIFGYNTSGSSSSNFVRDFSFKTKIGPELASMITIGATAQNKRTKNYDGTAFSKWNDGLEDAYAVKYDDPEETILDVGDKGDYETFPLTFAQLFEMKGKFEESEEDKWGWGVSRELNNWLGLSNDLTKIHEIELQGTKNIVDCPITNKDYDEVTWVEYVEEVKDQLNKGLLSDKPKEPLNNITNYLGWLIQAFAGNIENTWQGTPTYFYFNDDFYKIGKDLFKSFITNVNNEIYSKSRTPSNTIGFIPADLSLTIDGLSGVKIYNALSINQRFLPKQYPIALNFIVTKVNHDISSNNWSTSLHTIAVPKTAAYDASLLKVATSTVITEQQKVITNKTYKTTLRLNPQVNAARKIAEIYLERNMTDEEWNNLVAATAAESSPNEKEKAYVMAVILNRARAQNSSIFDVLTARNQFQAVTGTSANNRQPSSNFTNASQSTANSIFKGVEKYLREVPKDFKYFTAAADSAYGEGTDKSFRNRIENKVTIGGTIFGTDILKT